MNFHAWSFFIIGYVLFLNVEKCEGEDQCPESNTTARYVLTCPQSAKEWREALSRFNCQNIANNCSSFEYHCLMNHDTSKFVEVCAPIELIVGNNCVEYSFLGNRLQANRCVKCGKCPAVYNSSTIFQFPECFKKHTDPTQPTYLLSKKTTNEDNTDILTSSTAFKFLGAILLLVFVGGSFEWYINRSRRISEQNRSKEEKWSQWLEV